MKKKVSSKFRSLAIELTWNNIYIIIKSIISATDKIKCSTDPQTKYHSPKRFHIFLHFPFFMRRKCKKQNLYFYDVADILLLKQQVEIHSHGWTNQPGYFFFFLTLTKIDILGNKKNSKIYGLHLTEINIIFLMYYTTRFLD